MIPRSPPPPFPPPLSSSLPPPLFCVSLPLTVIQRDTVTDGLSMPQPIRALLRGLLGACGGLIGCPVPCLHACMCVCMSMYASMCECVPSVTPPLTHLGPTKTANTSNSRGFDVSHRTDICDIYATGLRDTTTHCLHTMDFLGGRREETRLTL